MEVVTYKIIFGWRYGTNRKERKDIRRGRKRIFLCGFCAIPRRFQRFLDHKLNLFSDKILGAFSNKISVLTGTK